jgi:hypothetical protein
MNNAMLTMEQTADRTNTSSPTVYKVAGVLAILIVLAGLTDAITSMGSPAVDNRSIPIKEWFALFQAGRFEAFSRLGVINMLTLSFCIPIYLAFHVAFRKDRPTIAAFAPILFLIGAAVYFSSNNVFTIYALSQQAALAPAAQKPIIEAAGRALLLQGADLSNGTFVGLFISQIAGLLVTSVMPAKPEFGKWIGITGLAGYSVMSVFFILTAFFPAYYDTAMILAAPGAILMIGYQVMLACRFFQLGKNAGGKR